MYMDILAMKFIFKIFVLIFSKSIIPTRVDAYCNRNIWTHIVGTIQAICWGKC